MRVACLGFVMLSIQCCFGEAENAVGQLFLAPSSMSEAATKLQELAARSFNHPEEQKSIDLGTFDVRQWRSRESLAKVQQNKIHLGDQTKDQPKKSKTKAKSKSQQMPHADKRKVSSAVAKQAPPRTSAIEMEVEALQGMSSEIHEIKNAFDHVAHSQVGRSQNGKSPVVQFSQTTCLTLFRDSSAGSEGSIFAAVDDMYIRLVQKGIWDGLKNAYGHEHALPRSVDSVNILKIADLRPQRFDPTKRSTVVCYRVSVDSQDEAQRLGQALKDDVFVQDFKKSYMLEARRLFPKLPVDHALLRVSPANDVVETSGSSELLATGLNAPSGIAGSNGKTHVVTPVRKQMGPGELSLPLAAIREAARGAAEATGGQFGRLMGDTAAQQVEQAYGNPLQVGTSMPNPGQQRQRPGPLGSFRNGKKEGTTIAIVMKAKLKLNDWMTIDKHVFQEKAAESLTEWLPEQVPNEGDFGKHLFSPEDVLVWWTHGSAKPDGTLPRESLVHKQLNLGNSDAFAKRNSMIERAPSKSGSSGTEHDDELEKETRFVNMIVDCHTKKVADRLKIRLSAHVNRLELAQKLAYGDFHPLFDDAHFDETGAMDLWTSVHQNLGSAREFNLRNSFAAALAHEPEPCKVAGGACSKFQALDALVNVPKPVNNGNGLGTAATGSDTQTKTQTQTATDKTQTEVDDHKEETQTASATDVQQQDDPVEKEESDTLASGTAQNSETQTQTEDDE